MSCLVVKTKYLPIDQYTNFAMKYLFSFHSFGTNIYISTRVEQEIHLLLSARFSWSRVARQTSSHTIICCTTHDYNINYMLKSFTDLFCCNTILLIFVKAYVFRLCNMVRFIINNIPLHLYK